VPLSVRAGSALRVGLAVAASLGLGGCLLEDGPSEADPDIPSSEYCDPVVEWSVDLSVVEGEIVEIVNERRAQGADCGPEGSFGAADPLAVHGALHCAARVHSLDMLEREFFDHVNPDGETPFDRMARAGYAYTAAAENIAQGQISADEVMSSWMSSPGHCRNIMDPHFTEIGVGVADGAHWTQTFGTR
jgi:uncharacterized protein YkwD